MYNESRRDPFSCERDFRGLNGRRKHRVVVGDNPDARIAQLQFSTYIKNNWPSQGHGRHRAGFIRFGNDKIFDLAGQTVDGKLAFIFLWSPEVANLWRRQIGEWKIFDWVSGASHGDSFAFHELFLEKCPEAAALRGSYRPFVENQIRSHLGALSIRELKDFVELLASPSIAADDGSRRKVA